MSFFQRKAGHEISKMQWSAHHTHGTEKMYYVSGQTIYVFRCVSFKTDKFTEDSSSRQIMHLVPIFILETHNQTNNECLPKFVQTDNAYSSIKTATTLKVKACI